MAGAFSSAQARLQRRRLQGRPLRVFPALQCLRLRAEQMTGYASGPGPPFAVGYRPDAPP